MAYEYYVCKISNETEINRKHKIPRSWVGKLEKDFKQIIFAGDIDKYALFTKKELLELASNYASWVEANNYNLESTHTKALDYINQFEDGVFLVSVIWWETGLT